MPETEDESYIRITPAILAVHCVERAMVEMDAAMNGTPMRWWFAITDMDHALTAALVETLKGSAGIGALTKKLQCEWVDYFENSRTDRTVASPKRETLASFAELIGRAKNPTNVTETGGALLLNLKDEKDILRLHQFRNQLLHVKPVHWSLEISGLPRMLGAVAEALRQLFNMTALRLRLEEDDVKKAEVAINVILSHAGRT
jgi:hypothetical protein